MIITIYTSYTSNVTGSRPGRDIVFNEKVMYKDQLQGKKEEKENTEYTVLDKIKEN